jgi:hypothetical protein
MTYLYLSLQFYFKVIMKDDLSKQLDFQRPLGANDFTKQPKIKKPNVFVEAIRTIHVKSVILAGVAGLVISIVSGFFHMHEASVQRDALDAQATVQNQMKGEALAISTISPEDFDKLSNYLKGNNKAYQRRVNVIINAYLQSRQISSDTVKADYVATQLSQALNDYQQQSTAQLASFNVVMQSVKHGQPFDIDAGKQLLVIYANYKNAQMTHDTDLDKLINDYGYPDHKGDMDYFQKNHIYEQIQLESEINH